MKRSSSAMALFHNIANLDVWDSEQLQQLLALGVVLGRNLD